MMRWVKAVKIFEHYIFVCTHVHVQQCCTFNVCSNGVEAGDLVGLSRVAPEDVVLWVNTNGRVGQILLSFSLKTKRKRTHNNNTITVCCMDDCRFKYWMLSLTFKKLPFCFELLPVNHDEILFLSFYGWWYQAYNNKKVVKVIKIRYI